MAETLNPDRYGLVLAGPLASRPPASSVGDKAIYVCTDQDGVVYVKTGRGEDWRRVLGAHTHLYSDIAGYLARWAIGTSYPPYAFVQSNEATLWRYTVPAHSIPGTVVKATRCQVILSTPPTGGSITFTFRRNGTPIATVTIPANETTAGVDLSPPVQLSDWDVLDVIGPTYGRGARGAQLQIWVSRERSA